jgi:DNA-binding NarL/FixJ family response regulator
MIRVLCVDDHRVVARSLGYLFRDIDGLEMVGHCSVAEQVGPMALDTNPDVVLMNTIMPRARGGDLEFCGLDCTQGLLADLPHVRVLIFSAITGSDVMERAKAAGAVGYIHKSTSPGSIIEAIRTVAAGETCWQEYGRAQQTKGDL